MLPQTILCVIASWWLHLILSTYAQIDDELCPKGAITIRDPKWPQISSGFELFAELTSNGGTSEIIQIFSNQRDAIMQTTNGATVLEYWYFNTNERFTILNMITDEQNQKLCMREMIDSLATTSTIESAIFIKPSVLLGYDARDENNPTFGVNFSRASFLKSMPVNIFESCFYLNDAHETVAINYYMTNVEKFSTFGYINDSIPLRIEVRTKSAINGKQGTYFYNIIRFTPNLTVKQLEQSLSLPLDIVCMNQTNTKPVPAHLSDHISINGEVLLTSEDKVVIESFDMTYDTSFQFARFKSLQTNGEQMIELHDFATGLVYNYLTSSRQCKVWAINGDTSDVVPVPDQSHVFQMTKPIHLFLLDDMNFQYRGSQQCHNRMLCHVWIGENTLSNQTGFERREWYWAYDFNTEIIEPWIPIRLVTIRFDIQRKPILRIETNLYNYGTNRSTAREVDNTIADCYRALGPTEKFYYGIFTFVIDNRNDQPVQNYSNYLKSNVWKTLIEALKIRPIRLSNIAIDRNGTDLIVTFTLVDNPPFYGPVANALKEPSLDELVTKLRTLIDKNNISFLGIYESSQVVRLYPKSGSLNIIARTPIIVLTNNITEIIYETVINTTKVARLISKEYSQGSKITAFWIGFLILGLAIGLMGTTFIIRIIIVRHQQ